MSAERLRAPFRSESERRLAQAAEHLRPEIEALGGDPSKDNPREVNFARQPFDNAIYSNEPNRDLRATRVT